MARESLCEAIAERVAELEARDEAGPAARQLAAAHPALRPGPHLEALRQHIAALLSALRLAAAAAPGVEWAAETRARDARVWRALVAASEAIDARVAGEGARCVAALMARAGAREALLAESASHPPPPPVAGAASSQQQQQQQPLAARAVAALTRALLSGHERVAGEALAAIEAAVGGDAPRKGEGEAAAPTRFGEAVAQCSAEWVAVLDAPPARLAVDLARLWRALDAAAPPHSADVGDALRLARRRWGLGAQQR